MRWGVFYFSLIVSMLAGIVFPGHSEAFDGKHDSEKSVQSGKATWTITAKNLTYQEEEGLYQAEGDVVFKKENQAIYGDKASYNTQTGMAKIKGNVRFESMEGVLTADEGEFDLKNQTGYLVNGQLFIEKNNYYISGDLIEKVSPDTYLIKDFRLTTCNGSTPDWSITGSEVRVILEDKGIVKNAAFRVRDIPVFYLPYMRFPIQKERQTGFLLPRIGYSSLNGLDTELPFFWAISDQFDATFYERYMAERGLMQGFEFRYAAENDSRGLFLFDILPDKVEEKDLTDPEELELSPTARTNRIRYWLRSRADQQTPFGFRARLDLDYVSDQDYLREFQGGLYGFEARPDIATEWNRPFEEVNSPFRTSALRLSHDEPDYSIQTLFSYHQRPEDIAQDQTPQPVSGLDFAVLPHPLAPLPLTFSFDTNYDYVWRDFGPRGHNLLISPKVSHTMWLGPYFSFEPSLGLTHQTVWLDDEPRGDDRWQNSDALRLETRLSTLLERIYELNWESAGLLKHRILPSLIYQYQYYDEGGTTPWFEPIQEEGKINRLALSLENFFDARREDSEGRVRYYQWARLSLTQGYDIDEATRDKDPLTSREPLEPLIGEVSLSPYDNLYLKAEAHWNHYQEDLDFFDFSMDFSLKRSSGRKDYLEIDYVFRKNESETLQYNLVVNLWPRIRAGTSLRRDINGGRDISTGYWLDYESQCWAVRLSAGSLDNVSNIMLTFRLIGIGG